MPIEKLEDLDSDLAAIIQSVAQLCGTEFPIRGLSGEFGKQMRNLRHCVTQKEMIWRYFIEPAHAGELLAQEPHLLLRHRERNRDVAHPRRTEALGTGEQRHDARESLFILRTQLRLVARNSNRCAFEDDRV